MRVNRRDCFGANVIAWRLLQGRWMESAEELERKLQGVVGDTLISAATIVYQGAFTPKYRADLTDEWVRLCTERGVPISREFDFSRSMVEPNQVSTAPVFNLNLRTGAGSVRLKDLT